MKAEYKDGVQPGEGYIILSEAMLPGEPWAIAVQRASDKLFLTGKDANPWVGDRIFVPVAGAAQPDGSLRLAIGPNVVDQLDQREQYRLILQGDGEELPGRLRLGQITHSRGGSQHNTGQMSAPQAEPEPQREPEAAAPPVTPPAQPAQENREPLQMAEKPAPGGRGSWRWLIVAALLLGCLAWYLLDQRKNEGENATPTVSGQEAPAKPAEKPRTAEEQVRQFFREGRHSPREAVELVGKLPRQTQAEQDAAYRLWYFAAENGEASAYMPYGRILDPSEPAYGSIEKNAPEAWSMYERAQETQPGESAAARAKLRQYLQELVARGDEKARNWLLQIDQPR